MKKIPPRVLQVIVFGLLSLWGAGFTVMGLSAQAEGRRAGSFPKTFAHILEARKLSASDSYEVKYEFQLADKKYQSKSVLPRFAWTVQESGDGSSLTLIVRDEQGAAHTLSVSAGDTAEVSYDPLRPEDSYLLPYMPSTFPFIAFGVVSLVLGILGLGRAIFRPMSTDALSE